MTTIIVNRLEDLPIPEYTKVLIWNIKDPLPLLPKNLVSLKCNLVTTLPLLLPSKLEYLECNSVSILPSLPRSLESLICHSVISLTKLPTKLVYLSYNRTVNRVRLPKSLKTIHTNEVKNIPKLHEGILNLYCKSMTYISGRLPDSLRYIYAPSLRALENPPLRLKRLRCSRETYLPECRNFIVYS